MSKTPEGSIIVGLDIGTNKVSALVGEVLPDGQVSVIGSGSCPSRGMDKGGVNDLESVVKSVQRAIDQAELMAECTITSVFISLSGKHIASQIEKGMGSISEEEVTQDDMDSVIHTAKSVKIGDEQRTLHVIPQEFSIDLQKGIRNPIGLSGMRMEVSVHLITCHNDMARNIVKAVERCGLKVEHIIFSGLASSNAVITEDERDLGVCVVDIGAGTMDIAIWTGGSLRHAEVLSYAGNSVTSDIAYAFGTPFNDAEKLKTKYGCAISENISRDETVNVPSVGGRPPRSLERRMLAEVIEPRYSELLSLVNQRILAIQEKLRNEGTKHHLAAGVVLTGGGAQIEGLVECAERVFDTQARIGQPLNVAGLTDYVKEPCQATAVGLLYYGKESQLLDDEDYAPSKGQSLTTVMKKFKNWVLKEF